MVQHCQSLEGTKAQLCAKCPARHCERTSLSQSQTLSSFLFKWHFQLCTHFKPCQSSHSYAQLLLAHLCSMVPIMRCQHCFMQDKLQHCPLWVYEICMCHCHQSQLCHHCLYFSLGKQATGRGKKERGKKPNSDWLYILSYDFKHLF